ncbi:3-isopropylmalate dehydrogenase [Nowakowskiella sp. JEL0078]|nr:3-isopropylmalate dehydrogenase [Nowakowskiella sp. JEL0078]
MAPKKEANIVFLAGDGIGPEIVAEAKKVLNLIASKVSGYHFNFTDHLIGGCAIDATALNHLYFVGVPLPEATLNACRNATAILLGAVGGPQWPRPSTKENPTPARPETGLLQIRKELDLFANIRPCMFPAPSLLKYSPLKESVVSGTEFTVIRELTSGIYFGKREEEKNGEAWDTMLYTVKEVQRITRIAAELSLLSTPPLPITSIDKANVLASSRLWRRVVSETLSKEYPSIPYTHNLVDSAAMVMVMNPRKLNGIVLTENMFGDILSDESSVIPGSLGLLPSASLSTWGIIPGKPGLYEPIHGSAPDIAGQGEYGIANPIGTILSVALLLRYSLGLQKEAEAVEEAVRIILDDTDVGGLGIRTKDLGGNANTSFVGDQVIKVLEGLL